MRITISIIFILLMFSLSGQTFEGSITYKVKVKTLIENHKNNDYYNKRWGDKMIISHDKNGNQYREFQNSGGVEYQIYLNSENRFYSKYVGFDTLYYYSCAENIFELISIDEKENKQILDHECSSVLKTEYLRQFNDTIRSKIFYSPKLKAPWQKYLNFEDGHLNRIYEKTKSHILWYDFKMREYLVEFEAIKIEEKDLNDEIFKIASNLPIKNIAE